MQIRAFWVDIENSSGQRLGRGPLRALNFNQTWLLSASGEFSFEVSAVDPNRAVLVEKRVAICRYLDRHGNVQIFGGGVIDKIVAALGRDGSLVWKVSGNDLGRELTYRSVGALNLSGVGAAGVTNAPSQIMALAPAGWALSGGTTLTSVYAGFDGETVLAALTRSGEKCGEHWRLGSGRVVQWLGPASTFAASGKRAVQQVNNPVSAETVDNLVVIASLEEESDCADLLTRVIPRGSGNGGVALTLAAATGAAPGGYTLNAAQNYVKRDAAEVAYGQIERVLDFKDIGPISNTTPDVQAAANTLLTAAVEHLRRYGAPQKFYRLELAQANTLLQPGTTLRVVYRKLVEGVVAYDLNQTLNIIRVEGQITAAGISTQAVTVSTIDRLPQTDADYLASQAVNAKILSAHQQLSASVDTLTWRDEMDSAKSASLRFWLGDEYTSISRAVLRFRIQPLRSTVKSVAGQTTTSDSGGGATSGSGGGQTASGGSHLHNTTIGPATPNLTAIGWYQSGGFLSPVTTNGATYTLQAGVNSNHSHDIANHTHSTPSHTHTLTPQISMQYGLYEESAGNTLALTDLVIRANGGADLRSSVTDIGNGWYALDLTDVLTDSVFRPGQENNEVTLSTATAKTARIEAQLTLRGVVQAVNYD